MGRLCWWSSQGWTNLLWQQRQHPKTTPQLSGEGEGHETFARQFLFERLLLHFSSRTDSKQLLPQAGRPHSHSWKNCFTYTRLLELILNAYCNCHDVTSVYSLNSWKLPGRFSYGLGTRLACMVSYCSHPLQQGEPYLMPPAVYRKLGN